MVSKPCLPMSDLEFLKAGYIFTVYNKVKLHLLVGKIVGNKFHQFTSNLYI